MCGFDVRGMKWEGGRWQREESIEGLMIGERINQLLEEVAILREERHAFQKREAKKVDGGEQAGGVQEVEEEVRGEGKEEKVKDEWGMDVWKGSRRK